MREWEAALLPLYLGWGGEAEGSRLTNLPGVDGFQAIHQRAIVAVGGRSQHGSPQRKVDAPHPLHLPPFDLGPLAAGELEGFLAHGCRERRESLPAGGFGPLSVRYR